MVIRKFQPIRRRSQPSQFQRRPVQPQRRFQRPIQQPQNSQDYVQSVFLGNKGTELMDFLC